jgi:hypothetical protein
MRMKGLLAGVVALVAGVVLAGGPPITFPKEKVPVAPWRIRGASNLTKSAASTSLFVQLQVTEVGHPVTGLQVMLNQTPIGEESPGKYRGRIDGYTPSTGAKVKVTLADPKSASPPLVAEASLGSPLSMITPLQDAVIGASAGNAIKVAWTGGMAPYRVAVYLQPTSTEVFSRSGIQSRIMALPTDNLNSGSGYTLLVISDLGQFSYSRGVDPGSFFNLMQTASVGFSCK